MEMSDEICPGVSFDQLGTLPPDLQAALHQLAQDLPDATFGVDGPETLNRRLVVIRTPECSTSVPWSDVLNVGPPYVARAVRNRSGWRRI